MPDPNMEDDAPEGEVIPTSDNSLPFKVVLRMGRKSAVEWGVGSMAEGEQQLSEALLRLNTKRKDSGENGLAQPTRGFAFL